MPELAATLQPLPPLRIREAELLAEMLRISRLTILSGEPGVGKTTLLTTGVLPLLRRRVADRRLDHSAHSGVVIPFPKCRRSARSARAEIAVFFDSWDDAPLPALTSRVLHALPAGHAQRVAPMATLSDNFALWGKEIGGRFLVLFDRFEQYLTAARDRPGIPEFADEFLRMLQHPALPVNFLISVRDEADPLIERLRASVRGSGDASLRLDPLEKRVPARVQPLHENEHARARTRERAALREESAGLVGSTPEDLAPTSDHQTTGDASQSAEPAITAAEQSSLAEPAVVSIDRGSGDEAVLARREESISEPTSPPVEDATGGNVDVADSETRLRQTSPAPERETALHLEPAAVAEESTAAPAPADSNETIRAGRVDSTAHVDTTAPGDSARSHAVAAASPATTPETSMNLETSAIAAIPRATMPEAFIDLPKPAVPPAGDPTPDATVLQGAPARPGRSWTSAARWLAAAGVVTSAALVIWTVRNVPVEQLPAPVAAEQSKSGTVAANNAPPAAPTVPALPAVTLITEPGNTTAAHVAADLTRVAAAAGAVRVVHRADLLSWPGDDAARLAIVPYEALAAAHTPGVRATTPEKLSVVTPLYTEEIHVLVRRDSPLTYIHDLRNAKISVGPSSGHGGLTAARLYERMFGTPLAPANVWTFPHAEALKKLVDEKSIDAMIVVAGQPARFLADLPSEVAASVKLLSLDREHPAGQRAIEAYLPTIIRSENYHRWLGQNTPALATMAFLITSENDSAQAAERLDLLTEAFCRNLPTLRREGHPKWREVQLGFEIDTGWPYSARARTAIQSCLAANQATAAPAR